MLLALLRSRVWDKVGLSELAAGLVPKKAAEGLVKH
jgi:hypothetical protein